MAEFSCFWCGALVKSEQVTCFQCNRSLSLQGYKIDGFLGRGGIGSVYSATGPGGQKAALKVVAPTADGGGWKAHELFEKSIRVLQGLSHPGLPKVYAFAKSEEDAKLFVIRERFDGGTLQERIQAGVSLEPETFRLLLERLLQILDYLHGRIPAIYHRDIKPSNIMFRSSMSWEPVLVDFDTISAAEAQRTGNTIVGTVGYTAPEQFAGMVSASSDIYSLGATMLYVATHVEPDALPKRDGQFKVEHLLQNLDAATRALVLQMVEPEKQKRPQSAQEALAKLGKEPQKGSSLGFSVSFKEEKAGPQKNVGPHQLQGLSVAKPPPVIVKETKLKAPQRSIGWIIALLVGGLLAFGGILGTLLLVRAKAPLPAVSVQAPPAQAASSMPPPKEVVAGEKPQGDTATSPNVSDIGGAQAMGPEQLSAAQIQSVMTKADFSSCKASGTGKVTMKITIQASGSVTEAKGDGSPLGLCLAGVIRKVKFPQISSPSQTFVYPLYVK